MNPSISDRVLTPFGEGTVINIDASDEPFNGLDVQVELDNRAAPWGRKFWFHHADLRPVPPPITLPPYTLLDPEADSPEALVAIMQRAHRGELPPEAASYEKARVSDRGSRAYCLTDEAIAYLNRKGGT
jgi:hypothetical protein